MTLTIAKKIALSYAIISAVIVALALLIGLNFSEYEKGADAQDARHHQILQVHEINCLKRDIILQAMHLIIDKRDASYHDHYANAFNEKFETLLNLKTALLKSAENPEEIQHIKSSFEKINAVKMKIFQILLPAFKAQDQATLYKSVATLEAMSHESDASIKQIEHAIEKELKQAREYVHHIREVTNNELIIGTLLVFGFSTLFGFFLTRNITQRINALKSNILTIADTKDLSLINPCKTPDEMGEIQRAFNTLITTFSDTLREAKQNAHENASISEELSRTSMVIGENAESQAEKPLAKRLKAVQIKPKPLVKDLKIPRHCYRPLHNTFKPSQQKLIPMRHVRLNSLAA